MSWDSYFIALSIPQIITIVMSLCASVVVLVAAIKIFMKNYKAAHADKNYNGNASCHGGTRSPKTSDNTLIYSHPDGVYSPPMRTITTIPGPAVSDTDRNTFQAALFEESYNVEAMKFEHGAN